MATTLKTNRILIVEDDPGIRGLMARQFRRIGYQVEQAAAAEEVLHRLQAGTDRFDVVVTDVHLPGESGVELARRIRAAQPQQAVVFMTGDTDASIARQALQNGAAGFLLKPFKFAELESVVKHAVQRSATTGPERLRLSKRGLDQRAHVTVPARVLLAPARPRRTNVAARVRVTIATAAILALAWLTGTALAPTPAIGAQSAVVPQIENNRPLVVPVVIDRTIVTK